MERAFWQRPSYFIMNRGQRTLHTDVDSAGADVAAEIAAALAIGSVVFKNKGLFYNEERKQFR